MGNIPAYAGKTDIADGDRYDPAEHPRVCGENAAFAASPAAIIGTSPRMRGKLHPHQARGSTGRNIPAYAGKTHPRAWMQLRSWEHPRVCGENTSRTCARLRKCGTSPRMRGKPVISIHSMLTQRNIPAYAGKTSGAVGGGGDDSEHPRVCGENLMRPNNRPEGRGTSPRMRGKRRFTTASEKEGRNIPAYAGKTGGRPRRSH